MDTWADMQVVAEAAQADLAIMGMTQVHNFITPPVGPVVLQLMVEMGEMVVTL